MTAAGRRFYETVTVRPGGGGFEVRLDERLVRTPSKAGLALPTRALAQAVADEWAAQGERVEPASMPLTGLACTAIDRIAPRRGEVVAEIVDYARTDMLCYRAERPRSLVERQGALWQPLLDWAAVELGAALQVTSGILAAGQPDAAVSALEGTVEALSDLELAALACATQASGSLIVALALGRGRLSAAEAFEVAELDATFQMEQWGEDPEATRRREGVHADLEVARKLFIMLAD